MKNGITLFLLLVASALFCVPTEWGGCDKLGRSRRASAPPAQDYKIIELPVESAQCMCKSNVYHVERTKQHSVFHRNPHRDETKRDGAVFWQFLVWHDYTKNVYLDVYFEGFRCKKRRAALYKELQENLLGDAKKIRDATASGENKVNDSQREAEEMVLRQKLTDWLIEKMKEFDQKLQNTCEGNVKCVIKAQFVFTLRIEECGGERNKLNRIRTWTANLTRKNVHLFQPRERSSPYFMTSRLNGPPTNFLNHNQKLQKGIQPHIGLENTIDTANVSYADWGPAISIPMPSPSAPPGTYAASATVDRQQFITGQVTVDSIPTPGTAQVIDVNAEPPSTGNLVAKPSAVNDGVIFYGSRTVNPRQVEIDGIIPKGMRLWKMSNRRGDGINYIPGYLEVTKSTFATVMNVKLEIVQTLSREGPLNTKRSQYANPVESQTMKTKLYHIPTSSMPPAGRTARI